MGYIPPPPKHQDCKDIRLTKAETKLLKIIKKRGSITEDEAAELSHKFKQDNAYLRLDALYLIRKSKEFEDRYEPFGRTDVWLDFHKENIRYRRLPLILSICAIAVSIAGVVTQWLLRVL